MVRTGAVAYERLRPVDTYAWWYMRALAWSVARVLPRAALMVAFAGVLLPLVGLGRWGLRAAAQPRSRRPVRCSRLLGMVLLSAAITLLHQRHHGRDAWTIAGPTRWPRRWSTCSPA